jgi:transcriptional regulator with XRE-family HTH domain
MSKPIVDPTVKKLNDLVEQSGKSMDELGVAMGYTKEIARQSVWQFLKKTTDPRISMLRRFARALNVPIEKIVAENIKKK